MEEKISIVMTSYNYADYIKEAIESVIAQTYQNWELVIIDDGSTDNSVEVIREYIKRDSRIKLFTHKGNINKGLAASVKLGVKKAETEWITFLESDDKLTPDAIAEKMNTINEIPGIDVLFTDLIMFGDEKKIEEVKKYFYARKKQLTELDSSQFIENFAKNVLMLNIIPTFSVVTAKKSLLIKCDYNTNCKASLDYYLWAQLAYCNFYYLHKKLTYWRIHNNSYINVDTHSWFTRYLFYSKLYYFTLQDKNPILRAFLLLNYMRARLIYLKLDKKSIKLNILNGKFIFEKFWQ